VYLTSSGLSAQPAPDARNPRTFLVLDQLILSVVPDGASASVLELGFRTAPGRSIRAEIPFPLTADVIAPFPPYRIDLATFREQAQDCDAESEPQRCANLSALFDHGEVTATRLWSEP
jgi:hypothetical protein